MPRDRAWSLDLPASIGDDAGVDLLREAVRHADLVNTVSPTYARESLTPEYGAGLDDVLRDRGERYIGIMNGVDPGRCGIPPRTRRWSPTTRRR